MDLHIIGMRLKVISPISDQTVKEGKLARFELELSHENVPVTWYKNETKLHPSRTILTHVDGKKHTLEIKDVTLDDTCLIKAEAKGISTTANLTVLGNLLYLVLYIVVDRSVQILMSCPTNVCLFNCWFSTILYCFLKT